MSRFKRHSQGFFDKDSVNDLPKIDITKTEPKTPISNIHSVYVGIDPGAQGALAVIDNTTAVWDIYDWPGDEVILANWLLEWFEGIDRVKVVNPELNVYVAIEKVHSMPGQGVASMFKFGTNFGIWRMAFSMLKLPFELVPPRTWQKGMLSPKQDPYPKMAAAGRLFPKAELYGPQGGKKDGRADALLIAYWLLIKRA